MQNEIEIVRWSVNAKKELKLKENKKCQAASGRDKQIVD